VSEVLAEVLDFLVTLKYRKSISLPCRVRAWVKGHAIHVLHHAAADEVYALYALAHIAELRRHGYELSHEMTMHAPVLHFYHAANRA
jgi:hypothetical protein